MKNSFLDYQIFPIVEIDEFSTTLIGENAKGVLIGYIEETLDEQRIYVEKIMAAAKLNLEKDCLILRGSAETAFLNFTQIRQGQTLKKAVLFGLKPSDIGLNITMPLYQPTLFGDCLFLFVDKPAVIETSKERRVALWTCLQHLFLQ